MLEPYEIALAKADAGELPESAKQYEDPKIRRLVAWCREMQRASDCESFFLASRLFGKLLDVSHTQANKWMTMLGDDGDGVLSMVSRGNRVTAPHYRYVASDLLAEPIPPETADAGNVLPVELAA
jgi:hypothetical protein